MTKKEDAEAKKAQADQAKKRDLAERTPRPNSHSNGQWLGACSAATQRLQTSERVQRT